MIKLKQLLLESVYSGYLIHATSSKYRDSIDQHGLIPKDIKESPHFTKDTKEFISYEKPAIFATKLEGELDVYGIANIKDSVYLVPSITFDTYKNYKKIALKKIDFDNRYNKIKQTGGKMVDFELYDLGVEFEDAVNDLLRKYGIYDIWLIDNNKAKVTWITDDFGMVGDFNRGSDNVGSVLTYQKIPRNAIELIVANGKNLKFKHM